MFPGAKFIHVVRDPLDNIVSQFRQFFAEGREYSYDIDALIFYWQGYLSLMKHWSETFSDAIYHLHYEKLVSSPDTEIANLLVFDYQPKTRVFVHTSQIEWCLHQALRK